MDTGPITAVTLEDGDVSVTLLSFGATTMDWRVPDGTGARLPVVLGHSDPEDYRRFPGYMGVTVGRYANRIGGARFVLDGVTHRLVANEGPNQLHGGPDGWHLRNWTVARDGARAVRFSLRSPEGDMGFPGTVEAVLTATLTGHRLTWEMAATPDRPTHISLANHTYYNLLGDGPIWDHQMQIAASTITEVDTALIPTGRLLPVAGTRHDYRAARRLGDADPEAQGTDVNFALDTTQDGPACTVTAPNGMRLRMWTDQPGLQVYSGAGLTPVGSRLPGQSHAPFTGLALEPQHFPDSPNQPGFPSTLCTPDHPYRQRTEIEICPVS